MLGAIMLPLAVVVNRAEGPLKISPTGGLETTLRQLATQATRDTTLEPKLKDEVLAAAAEQLSELPTAASREEAESLATTLYFRARSSVVDFEHRVIEWLKKERWTFSELRQPGHVDYLASRDGDRMYVEIKFTSRPLDRGMFLTWLPRLLTVKSTDPSAHVALFISAPTVTEKALEAITDSPVAVYLDRDGGIERVNAPPAGGK